MSVGNTAMSWDYPNPFTSNILVAADDIDGLGHVNNACYVVWCEQCAWKHSELLGLNIADYQRLDRGVAINKADYDYFLPSFNREELIVGTWLTACDEKLRLERSFQTINRETGATVMRGSWQLICVTLSTGKPSRFPQEFLDSYATAVI
ncbi:MAG: thioesterase family protein [Gammaproteobacteria bacterium]|jgi:acyl-CoA thioester hydrolase|nr:thioesterase family protein [Gammaproteobacteria bacterium]|tara:strand:+ start:4755 stop:5204 length:450 start_codon:yes stop_codon:yes gene_type:complete